MAYDEDLADRIRSSLENQDGVTEMRMFGGMAFLVSGNMAVSASGQGGLLLRVDPRDMDTVMREDGVTGFEMRGRAMTGWVRVDPSATASDRELTRWVQVGVTYAGSLPPK
jgi:TfoX/Sxy family transcriptional regulator of competence genes